MSEEIFARKYRPKVLTDVIGQEVVVQSLTNAFKSKNLHQAYIFEGNRGSGKTSCARILAAMENCEKGPTLEPCGVCDNCKAIFTGKSMDVREMDAASNRSIDDIRAIKEDIKMAAINSKKKYVIIDEIHSLTGPAAESGLKMVEEPPPNVRFVLCTTDAYKLIETIQDRCISFRFNKIIWYDICQNLIKICKLENVKIDEDALKVISKSARGSVRKSLQNLEKVISYKGIANQICSDDAIKALGAVEQNAFFHLFDSIGKKNITKSYQIIQKIFLTGQQLGQVIDDMTEHLSNMLAIKMCTGHLEIFDFTEEEIKKYEYQVSQFTKEQIIGMMEMIVVLNRAIEFNTRPQSMFEKFVIQCMSV